MNKFLFFSLILLAQICWAQTKSLKAIPGTKCSMVPPEGFEQATNFSGFQQEATGASIMVNELPGSYQEIVQSFTKEAFDSRGIHLLTNETIEHQGKSATFVTASQEAYGVTYLKQLLLLGTDNYVVLVTGNYPEEQASLGTLIKQAILTTVYNAGHKPDPLEAVPFTIDVPPSKFKLVQYLSGSLLYTADGKVPTEEPNLIVSSSLGTVPVTDRKAYSIQRLREIPDADLKQIKEVTIDGLDGYELFAERITEENNKEFIYLVQLFQDEGGYFILLGITKKDFERYQQDYSKIARTFKRKK